ncbi:MAG: serine/threonine-protein kinase [Planctomycetota bacterium]
MNPENRRRAFEIFDEICELSEPARSAELRNRCGNDDELLAAIVRMLEADTTEHEGINPGAGAQLLAAELTDEEAPVPDRIGRYRVIRELGRGGMGVVYEAEQDEPRRRVAVKVIRDAAAGREVSRRFRLESQLLGRLQHPGIAQVYEAGTDTAGGARRAFYAMEFVDGLPVDRHADGTRLSTEQRVELIARVCDAMHHAHQKGVLHRDIKPANVLVISGDDATTATGTRSGTIDAIGQPKIVDFGVARLTDDATEHSAHQTHAGQIIGSLPCMSPEQLSGNRDAIDTRTDVYAIGVLLYRLLAGRSPHDLTGMSIPKAARIVAEREPIPLANENPSLRGDLSVIVSRAMEREPERRYDSAAALGDDLRRYLRGEPILARPASGWYRFVKFAKRHKPELAAGVGVALLLIASTIFSSSLAVRESNARQSADRATYRASISAAAAALRDGDSRLAREFLMDAPPALRGWEWAYFQNQLDQSTERGRRSIRQQGDLADFAHMGAWLSDDETVLHTATTYLFNAPLQFESFETSSMRSLGSWELPAKERSLGVLAGPARILLVDVDSNEFIERDCLTGDELRRWAASHEVNQPLSTFDWLPGEDESRSAWISFATSLHIKHSRMGTISSSATAWSTWAGRDPHIWLKGDDEPSVLLPQQREGASRTRFGPDGQTIAMVTLDRQVMLLDAKTGHRIWHNDEAHTDAPMSVAFSPDGTVLATGGQDRKVRLWNTADGAPLGTLIGHDATVLALCFSEDGETLYSSDHAEVRRWHVADAFAAGVVSTHRYFVHRVSASPDGRFVASCNPSRPPSIPDIIDVRVRQTDQIQPARTVSTPEWISRVIDVEFSSPTTLLLLAAGKVDGSEAQPVLLEYDAESLDLVRAVPLGAQNLKSFMHPNNLRHAILRVDNTLSIVSGANEQAYALPSLEPVAGDAIPRRSLAVNDAGGVAIRHTADPPVILAGLFGANLGRHVVDVRRSRVFVATTDRRVRAFSLDTGRELATTRSLPTTVDSLALLPDGSRLFAGCGDTAIRVWDAESLELAAVLRGHRDSVNDLAVSPDGSTLYSASDDYTVRAWATTPIGD